MEQVVLVVFTLIRLLPSVMNFDPGNRGWTLYISISSILNSLENPGGAAVPAITLETWFASSLLSLLTCAMSNSLIIESFTEDESGNLSTTVLDANITLAYSTINTFH
jgi:hypothetical protein